MAYGKKVLVSEDSAELGEIFREKLEQRGYRVIVKKRDGFAVLAAIREEQPHVVIMDAQMRHLDAVSVLQNMPEKKPSVIVTSAFPNAFLEKLVAEDPRCCYLLKPFELSALIDRVELLCGDELTAFKTRPVKETISQQELEVRITAMLHQIGMPPHIKGYHYLREAVLLSVNHRKTALSVTKQLYPAVAKKFGTKASRVERTIRHAIEVAWDRGNMEVLNRYFGYASQLAKGKPTNAELIAMLADKLRMQLQMENKEIVREAR